MNNLKNTWKDQILMTIELAKFKSAETDDNELGGDNSACSNDIARFTYALDGLSNRTKYQGGLIGGDLIGFRSKVPYLKQLGITTVIIYPIMDGIKNNVDIYLPTGYGVKDWTVIDPNFRGPGESPSDYSSYINLVKDLHDPDIGGHRINVLQDISLSMCGLEHPWFTPEASSTNIDYFKKLNPDNPNINTDNHEGHPYLFEHKMVFDISTLFNEDAFSYDTDRSDGNFGDKGFTYPAEQIGYGASYTDSCNNMLFYELGLKLNGNRNAIRGSISQDICIPIPSAKYASIGIALSATNGDHYTTFRVCYNDDTYTDSYVFVNAWDSETGNNDCLVSFPHMHSSTSDVQQKVYIYCTTLNLDTTKIVKCISLLKDDEAENIHIFSISGTPVIHPLKVDLTDYYNEDGISWDGCKGDGSLSDCGLLFPVEKHNCRSLETCVTADFGLGTPWHFKSNFTLGPRMNGKCNMVMAKGQSIAVKKEKYHKFALAAFSTTSDQVDQVFIINYSDGTSSTTTITVKNITSELEASDVLVYESDHAHSFNGKGWSDDMEVKLRIWGYLLKADCEKQVTSITLPDNSNVHIAAINPVIFIASAWGMPLLDHTNGLHDNTGLFKYFWEDVFKFWVEKSNIDGFRVDSAQSFHTDYWKTFINKYWKATYPEKLLFGEAAVAEPTRANPTGSLSDYQIHREQYVNSEDNLNFDALYDFEMSDALRETFAKDMPANGDAFSLIQRSLQWDKRYDEPWNQVIFFDVYENFPFLKEIDNEMYPDYSHKLPKIKLAAAYIFTMNRVPMLFSGGEYLLNYGAYETPGTNATKPGYLFSSEVICNAAYQDNHKYIQALINMRKNNPALRSAEKMSESKWIRQGETLFGYIRQEKGYPSIVVMFNNSPSPLSAFNINLPQGVIGRDNWNFILKDATGSYGSPDITVSWPESSILRISNMNPWEVKIIKI